MSRSPSVRYPLALLLLLVSFTATADYDIPQCVLGGGGGGRMGGASYILSGTVGQTAIGRVTGPSYIHGIGFWYPAQAFASGAPEIEVLPAHFALGPSYPSPGGPVTTFRLAIPRTTRVALRLFDVTGRQVRTLLEGELPPGFHTVLLDGTALAAGVYFCRMTAPAFSETRRLVLVK